MSAAAKLPRWAEYGLLPLINLCAALLISGAVIRLIGESPWAALKLMSAGAFGAQDSIGYTLFYATDFVFTGLAVAVAFHAGLFNIGGEGQAYIGGLGVGLVCLAFGSWSPWVVVPMGIAAGCIFGAAWAFVPAWLQARRGSHIVITTIMSNFIASALMTYLLVNVLIKPGQQSPESREFGPGAGMPAVHEVLGRMGISFAPSPFNLASLLALAACFFVWIFIWRTRWGYSLRVVGQNPQAAVYAGISPERTIIVAMVISGGLAGCLGVNELMGSQHRILLDFPGGAGFVGIAVALMGRNHPVGILAASLLFGALYQGGSQLSFDMPHVNRDMVVLIQGLVILFCGALENVFRRPLSALLVSAPQVNGPLQGDHPSSRRDDPGRDSAGPRRDGRPFLGALGNDRSEPRGKDAGGRIRVRRGFGGHGLRMAGPLRGYRGRRPPRPCHRVRVRDPQGQPGRRCDGDQHPGRGACARAGARVVRLGGQTPQLDGPHQRFLGLAWPGSAAARRRPAARTRLFGTPEWPQPDRLHCRGPCPRGGLGALPHAFWPAAARRRGEPARRGHRGDIRRSSCATRPASFRGSSAASRGRTSQRRRAPGFVRDMTAGKGYLALAALIFGKWRPYPTLLACLLFAFADAAAARIQGVPLPVVGIVPVQLIIALPYILTIFLLAGFVGEAIPPRAIGVPYSKEK